MTVTSRACPHAFRPRFCPEGEAARLAARSQLLARLRIAVEREIDPPWRFRGRDCRRGFWWRTRPHLRRQGMPWLQLATSGPCADARPAGPAQSEGE